MRHAARAPPPPILKVGVLVHASAAAAGVLQNGKLKQCNFAVEISEGSRQFLMVRCGRSPFRDLQFYVLKRWRIENLSKIMKNLSNTSKKASLGLMSAFLDTLAICRFPKFSACS